MWLIRDLGGYCKETSSDIINTPISWRKEKRIIGIIAVVTLALLAYGALCYKYKFGPHEAKSPGYNRRFAKVLFLAAGLIPTITSLVYCIRLYKHSGSISASSAPRRQTVGQ